MYRLILFFALIVMSVQSFAHKGNRSKLKGTDGTVASEQCVVALATGSTELEIKPTEEIGTITENMQNLSAAVKQITTMVEGESPEWAVRLKERVQEVSATTGQIVKTAVQFNNLYQKQAANLSDSKSNQLRANLGVEISRFQKKVIEGENRFLGLLKSSAQLLKTLPWSRSEKITLAEKATRDLEACFRQTQCARNSMFEGIINLGVLNEQVESYVKVLDDGINNITQVERAIEQEFVSVGINQNVETEVNKISLRTVHTTLLTTLNRAKSVAINEKNRLLDIHETIKLEQSVFRANVEQIDGSIDETRNQLDRIKTEVLFNDRTELVGTIEHLVEVLLGIESPVIGSTVASGQSTALVNSAKVIKQLPAALDGEYRELVGRMTDENQLQRTLDNLNAITKRLYARGSVRELAELNLFDGTSSSTINSALEVFWKEYGLFVRNKPTSASAPSYFPGNASTRTLFRRTFGQLNADLAYAGSGTKNTFVTKTDFEGDSYVKPRGGSGYYGEITLLWLYVYNLKPANLDAEIMVNLNEAIQRVYKDSPEFPEKSLTLAIVLKKVSEFTDQATWKKVTAKIGE